MSVMTKDNAETVRAVAKYWEDFGSCPAFPHMLACAITHQALGFNRRLPMFGDDSDIGLHIISMTLAAHVIEQHINQVPCK